MGRALSAYPNHFRSDFARVYTTSLCIMPALQFLNHRWVPIDLRVLYMNGASLLWNAVLSHLVYAHTANPTTPKAGATATSR